MSPSPGTRIRAALAAAALTLLLAGLLTVAWVVPALAMLVVWPILFLVPGWAAVALLRPRIGSTGRLGLAVIGSVAVSAHLVYWLSLLAGYQRATIFVAAALLAAPVPLAVAFGGVRVLGAQLRSAVAAGRREAGALTFALAAGGFVGLVLASSLWRPVPGGVAAGGSNWSDLGVHLSIAQSINAGNFPPDVPYFAGAPLVYHWFADFHAAIAAKSAGLFAVPAFVISSAILTAALALLVHGLARLLLRGRGARRAALLAAAIVIVGGGLGWIRLVSDLANGYGDPVSLVLHNSYDNAWYDALGQPSWPYFRIPSVMGTGLLVHRATTAGLPMLVGALLLLVSALPTRRRWRRGFRDRPAIILAAGVLGAMLAPFHFFFFPALLLLALGYVVLGGRLVDRFAPRNALLFLSPLVLALPFAVPALLQSGGSGWLRVVVGWESAPLADGGAAVLFFYLTNLGLPFVLALAALLVPGTPRRLFLAAWVAAMFAIPNLLQVSAVGFDMNKYFQAMWIAVALLAAWLIRRWPWPAVALVLAISIPSPLLVAAWTGLNREQVLSVAELRAADWIAVSTPPRAVFVTDGWLNAPTDPAGRLRLLTYTPYVANLGYQPGEREAQVHAIYCDGDPARSVALMRETGASYLIEDGLPADCGSPTDFAASSELLLAYDQDGIRIWRLPGEETGAAPSRPMTAARIIVR
jgi:hypothetical protein